MRSIIRFSVPFSTLLAAATTLAILTSSQFPINAQTAVPTAAPTQVATPAATQSATQAAAIPVPAFPAKPINLQVIDVGGALQLVRGMIDNYAKANPDKVASVSYVTDTAPNLPGRIKAQIDAGKIDTTLVLGGYDAVSTGIAQGNWMQITPEYSAKFPGLDDNYLPGAENFSKLAQGYAVEAVYTPGGPVFEYDPSQVDKAPTTIDELKTWIAANPNKFIYPRPANSGPGRTFLMGLPYLLGDANPKDPVNGWTKTWAFLKDIDQNIEYYPSRTADAIAELGNGTRAMMPLQLGWDINPRVLGSVPPTYQDFSLTGVHFVSDAQFMMVPKGLDNDRLSVVLDLMSWMLKPDQQAIAYDKGYFYPGPSVKGVTVSMAPQTSQDAIKNFVRPEYADWIANTPSELPLDAKSLVTAFKMWDTMIGQNKIHVAPTAIPSPTKAS